MVRMWASAIVIYLLIGVVLQVIHMYFVPAFRKGLESARQHGKVHFVAIGSLLGILIWPIPLVVAFAALRSKKIKRCQDCGLQILWNRCDNCGPRKREADQSDDR